MSKIRNADIERAQAGDRKALEMVVRGVQDRVYRLAARMLANPVAAEDATQEILIRIVTKLSTYRAESSFETWSYRVATNYLLTAKKVIAKDIGLSFQMFSDDLLNGLADENHAAPEDHVLLNELRLKCTMAMLLCLDREHRAAYVLGDVLELEHTEASHILDIAPATYRKRLSRARKSVEEFTAATCGLANRAAPCSCPKRLPAAISAGRIHPEKPANLRDVPKYQTVQALAANVETNLVAAKLQRATGPLRPLKDYAVGVLQIVDPSG